MDSDNVKSDFAKNSWSFSFSAQGVCKWGCGKFNCLDETETYNIQKTGNYNLNTPNQTGACSPVLYIGGEKMLLIII